ncbi:App1 family protein [Pollutibacter soli]|uniref:App1 family protein n=1 Tax=Pollutibacter soli TaxID=3034157 RepID=UPI0030137FE9
MHIKLYYGFGHTHDLVIYGHLFENKPIVRKRYSNSVLRNTWHLIRLFFLRPVPFKKIQLFWDKSTVSNYTASDGFIHLEWRSEKSVPAGWHPVHVQHHVSGEIISAHGELFVPHVTQYAFISDIDDTILVSHSASIFKRLWELVSSNPRTRDIFSGAAKHYQLLAHSNTTPEAPNPFFYVSSSEWNLYDYLVDFFDHNKMPKGAFLLNHVKRWYEFFLSGKTNHNGKLMRIARILHTFPNQRFILLGDNTQRDPVIYNSIARKYPGRVHAIYIRNARSGREAATREILDALQNETGVHCCLFRDSEEAIQHSRKIGLIL